MNVAQITSHAQHQSAVPSIDVKYASAIGLSANITQNQAIFLTRGERVIADVVSSNVWELSDVALDARSNFPAGSRDVRFDD